MGSCNGMTFFTSNFMSVQTPHEEDHRHHHPSTSLNTLLPSCSPQDFHGGVASVLVGKRSSNMSFSSSGFDQVNCDQEAAKDNNNINGVLVDDDYSDDGSQVGEKKRRLNMEQVKTLEKNFELGNKLEPERKMQLARALGLQPRQIAIWFQNRRARWKTKQLEKDYDLLKRQFEAIKADNDALQAQNKKLHAQILALKSGEPTEFIINLNNKETEDSSSNRSENSSELNLDISRTPPAIDSPPLSSSHHQHHQHHHHHHHPSLFSSSIIRPAATNHLAQQLQQQYPKIEPTNTNVQEESFTNMFCAIDDQPNFWPWQEHQQFH